MVMTTLYGLCMLFEIRAALNIYNVTYNQFEVCVANLCIRYDPIGLYIGILSRK